MQPPTEMPTASGMSRCPFRLSSVPAGSKNRTGVGDSRWHPGLIPAQPDAPHRLHHPFLSNPSPVAIISKPGEERATVEEKRVWARLGAGTPLASCFDTKSSKTRAPLPTSPSSTQPPKERTKVCEEDHTRAAEDAVEAKGRKRREVGAVSADESCRFQGGRGIVQQGCKGPLVLRGTLPRFPSWAGLPPPRQALIATHRRLSSL